MIVRADPVVTVVIVPTFENRADPTGILSTCNATFPPAATGGTAFPAPAPIASGTLETTAKITAPCSTPRTSARPHPCRTSCFLVPVSCFFKRARNITHLKKVPALKPKPTTNPTPKRRRPSLCVLCVSVAPVSVFLLLDS